MRRAGCSRCWTPLNQGDGAPRPPARAPEALRARQRAPAAHAAGGAQDAGAVGLRGDRRADAGLAGDAPHRRARHAARQPDAFSLAKVEQLRQQGDAPVVDWAEIARGGAGPRRSLPSASSTSRSPPCRRRCAHEWALRELTRNLLHNAIRHCREGGTLAMRFRERRPRPR